MKIGKIGIWAVIGLVLISSAGCRSARQSEKIVKKELEERYQEEFQVKGNRTYPFEGYTTGMAYSESNPSLPFTVSIGNDGTSISDNYVNVRVCDKMSKQIKENLGLQDNEAYIYSNLRISVVNLDNKDMSVKEYVKEYPSCAFRTYYFICADAAEQRDLNEDMEKMFSGLDFIEDKVFLYVVPNQDSLQKIRTYLETNDQMYDEFSAISDLYYINADIEFANGLWNITAEEILKKIRNK